MKNIFKFGIIFLTLLSLVGCTRTLPIHNVENQSIGHKLSLIEIEKAILKAGNEKGWAMSVVKPGEIQAVLLVRNHKAEVVITYNEQAYSINYQDSMNLSYEDGKIHRNYNKWVILLDQKIQANLIIASSR